MRTAHLEACALIDGCDAFDPHCGGSGGRGVEKLLWVRCKNIQQSLRATDLLLQSGGFGFIALDLSDVSREVVRHVPLDAWFRFRRAVEDTQTILVVLEQESNAKTCASLVLHLAGEAGTMGGKFRQACTNPFQRQIRQAFKITERISRARGSFAFAGAAGDGNFGQHHSSRRACGLRILRQIGSGF